MCNTLDIQDSVIKNPYWRDDQPPSTGVNIDPDELGMSDATESIYNGALFTGILR